VLVIIIGPVVFSINEFFFIIAAAININIVIVREFTHAGVTVAVIDTASNIICRRQ
jgi:hypothetical protein